MVQKLSCTIKTDKTEINIRAEFVSVKQVDQSSLTKKPLVSGFFEVVTWVYSIINLVNSLISFFN